MHTQTESAQEHPAGTAPTLPPAAGLGLYLLTLAVEAVLAASARWLLFYLGAATVGAIVPLGLSAEALAYAAAFAPLAWSVVGLAIPGDGQVWRRRLGARRPTAEEALVLADALVLLRGADPSLPDPVLYVLDDPLPSAAVRGCALIISRGLLESESLAAVLAHELGHVESLDGRLTEALQRLVVWADPLGPPNRHGAPPPADDFEPEPEPEPWSGLRLFLRLAGGGVAEQLFAPLWSAYWRSREYAADSYAASLGQAEDLARHLGDFEQPFDAPQPGLIFKAADHPPVALRIERLHEYSMRGGSK
jgi:Zn-dependent protease with chaperone function